MNAMWQAMRGKSFDALRLRVSEAVAEGYPMSAVLSQLQSDVIYKQGLTNTEKALFCEKIANVSFSLFSRNFDKCDVFIFLQYVAASFLFTVSGPPSPHLWFLSDDRRPTKILAMGLMRSCN
jgi:hypothetical protein